MNREFKLIGVVVTILFAHISLSARDFVHVFTSKGIYETCEDLWFKCLVMDGRTFALSDKSHTAYVELVNPSDSVVWAEKYPVIGGECHGQIYVGDNWSSGEYRLYAHTRESLGLSDTIMTPKRILIVRELPEVENFKTENSNLRIDRTRVLSDEAFNKATVVIELDSVAYHTRSRVRAKINVRDSIGNPLKVKIAISVYDRLYHYPIGELGLRSNCEAVANSVWNDGCDKVDGFLADGVSYGFLKSRKKKNKTPLEGQFINVFDFSNSTGVLNVVTTASDGYFEIPSDIASSLGRDILLKPISGKSMKPEIEFIDLFGRIDSIRNLSRDRYFSDMRYAGVEDVESDSLDVLGRRGVKLGEVVVSGRAGRYPKRNKFMGYLDSISTLDGGAWVCGCPAGYNTTFLNDYIPGYTHHPNGSGHPDKISRPVKGKSYEIIKYTDGTMQGVANSGYVEDIQYVEYTGPKYTEDELLRMNGLWKTQGYYPDHSFEMPDEEEMSFGLEDNRNTLLWLPESETDESGELVLEFWTSDIKSLFRIQGILYSGDGRYVDDFESVVRVLR